MKKLNDILSPIFHQPWWLDIVCATSTWDYSISKTKSGEITGVLPYYRTGVFGMTFLRMPPLTPYLGPLIIYPTNPQKRHSKYSFEQRVMDDLLDSLPDFTYFHQIFPYEIENWLPFYKRGFRQTTRYTYVFERLDLNIVYDGMNDNTRNKIRKAEKSIVITKQGTLKDFFRLSAATFERQSLTVPYSIDMFVRLHSAIQEKEQGCLFFAKNNTGHIGAALYLIWDEASAYLWQLGAEVGFRNSGAVQLLIWSAIQEAHRRQLKFNFEGSMLPHIEPVFRAFGAERKPVHEIYKTPNRFFDAVRAMIKR